MNKSLSALGLVLTAISINASANELYYETVPTFQSTSKGTLLVGHENLGLYTYKKDVNSPIPPKCKTTKDNGPLGSCLARWPAAVVSESNMASLIDSDNKFGAVYNNEINKLQLTYSGLPVYYWFKDSPENNFTGDGVGKVWSLIPQGKDPIMFNGLNK